MEAEAAGHQVEAVEVFQAEAEALVVEEVAEAGNYFNGELNPETSGENEELDLQIFQSS